MKRYRWVCPECGAGKLAGKAPRKDATVRFCLDCSAKTGKLVQRTCPALDRERAQRAERTSAKQARHRAREAAKKAAKAAVLADRIARCGRFQCVFGVDLKKLKRKVELNWKSGRGPYFKTNIALHAGRYSVSEAWSWKRHRGEHWSWDYDFTVRPGTTKGAFMRVVCGIWLRHLAVPTLRGTTNDEWRWIADPWLSRTGLYTEMGDGDAKTCALTWGILNDTWGALDLQKTVQEARRKSAGLAVRVDQQLEAFEGVKRA